MVDLYKFLAVFLMTLGIITLMTSFIWSRIITGDLRGTVEAYQFSSPVFAFVGSIASMYLLSKAFHESMKANLWISLVAGILVILLYTIAPQYLPPSFAIISP